MSVTTTPRSGVRPGAPPPPGGPPVAPSGLPPNGPPPQAPEPPARRPGWKRILLGAVVVLLCAGGISAVFVVEQVHNLRDALKQNGVLNVGSGTLATAGAGDPQTLLLVGDDTRKGFKYYRGYVPDLANEMLLVRIDPSRPYISMMSIPRELSVPITKPDGTTYVGRLNSSYTFGIKTLVTTIKQVTGLSVNHVIVITFPRFKRAVDEMGCVYSTVDRRYYNLNLGTPGTNYQSINLQPGYQKLCGEQALEFVSYRHGDTSLIRDARDQSFLLDVKKQYGPTLSGSVGKFEHIFGKAVQTDRGLQSSSGLINLIDTLIFSAGRSVRQVHFQANLQATFDTASPQQIQTSVHNFLYGVSPINKQHTAAVANAIHNHKARLPLVPTPPLAQSQARAEALKLPFPLEFPRVEDRGGSVVPSSLRRYLIHGPDKSAYQTYVGVFYAGSLGQYYDVQGMTWTTAPQFDSPDQTVRVGSRNYHLYYEGSNVKMVAWYEHGAVYWVRNTLTDSLGSGELLAIAEQTQPFTAVHSTTKVPVILKAVGVPTRLAAKKHVSMRLLVGGLAGLITLVALPLLAFLALRRIMDLRRARPHVRLGQEAGERLAARGGLAALPAGPSADVRRLLGLDGLRRGVLSGVGGGTPHVASGHWSEGTRTYHASRIRRPRFIVPVLVLLALGAGAAVYLGTRGHTAQPTRPAKPVHRTPTIPTERVVVLNATSTPGAAHDLALSLQASHVQVSAVGNVTETLPAGTEILYAPGQHFQATLLARVLKSRSPTIAPIDPVTSAAAAGAKLVVVIA